MAMFRIDTRWPSGTISRGEKVGDGLQLSKEGCWWLMKGDELIMGFKPDLGGPEDGGRKTIIRLV